MASPIGHALAGIAVAWAADLFPGRSEPRDEPPSTSWYHRTGGGLMVTCAALAAAPDLDLFFGSFHRTATHSVTAVAAVAIVAALVARRTGRSPWRLAAICATAWATHLLLDWLSADRSLPAGIQLLWPFDARWFISGWDLFAGSERRRLFSAATLTLNARAIGWELVVLVPILAGLWLVRVKALAGLATELARRDHPAQ